MNTMLFAAFPDRDDAHRAVEELASHGFSAEELSVITKQADIATPHTTTAGSTASGLVGGATTGGIVGGIAGLLAGAGVFPALAGLLIGGPIAAALGLTGIAAAAASGAMTGAAVGGFVGALMGLGFSRSEAEYYGETVELGGLLLAVSVDEVNMEEAMHILKANHAQQIKELGLDSVFAKQRAAGRLGARHERDIDLLDETKVDERDRAASRRKR